MSKRDGFEALESAVQGFFREHGDNWADYDLTIYLFNHGVRLPEAEDEAKIDRIYREWHDRSGRRLDTFAEWAVRQGVTVNERPISRGGEE